MLNQQYIFCVFFLLESRIVHLSLLDVKSIGRQQRLHRFCRYQKVGQNCKIQTSSKSSLDQNQNHLITGAAKEARFAYIVFNKSK